MVGGRAWLVGLIAGVAVSGQVRAGGQAVPSSAPEATVTRVGEYIQQYYSRAQSVVARELVTLQPLTRDFGAEGFARRLEYEMRVEWNPGNGDESVTVVRELIKASGRALGSPDDPDCLDPKGVSPEPLAFLLPERRDALVWKWIGSASVGGRPAAVMEYRPLRREPPKVDWVKDCATIDMPGHTMRRVWADAGTAEVLRVDEHLVGPVDIPAPRTNRRRLGPDYFTVERADTSIRYKAVTFTDPDETILLPSEITSLTVILNSGVPRMRTTQVFSNYRRYVTGSRLVVE